jgi:acyl dehydratase
LPGIKDRGGTTRTFQGVAALESAVGQHLGHSEWHTITQAQIDAFAEATGDRQWIHVDPIRAASGPFGTTIAHGYLTLSLIPALVAQVYRVEGTAMAVNYGANRVRFVSPVPVGASVRAGVELLAVSEASIGHQVTTRVVIEARDAVKPACVAEVLSIIAI